MYKILSKKLFVSLLIPSLLLSSVTGLFLVKPKVARAAYAFVQGQYESRATGVAHAFSSNNTAGNTIVVAAGWNGTGTPTISDTAGNTYSLAKSQTNGSWTAGVWIAHNIVGGANSVTLTLTGESFDATYLEYSGLVSTDQVAGASGFGGTPSSGSTPNTTQSNEMILGFYVHNASSLSSGSGFTSRVGGVNNFYVGVEDKRVLSTGQYSATFSTATGNWLVVGVALKEVALPADVTSPVVTITTPATSTVTTTTAPYASIAGTSSDNVGVSSCSWSNNKGSTGSVTGTTSWSASNISIYPGDNVITITCVDAAANEGTASFTITYNADTSNGGFLEADNTATVRPALVGSNVNIPTQRGSFVFPSPYGTLGYRLTQSTDCTGQDCVDYVGYSYWSNINNSTGSNTMYIFVGLRASAGGDGPNLFSINKTTNAVTKVGPLFDPGDTRRNSNGEGWYFSATSPTMLYINTSVSPILSRYEILARTTSTVFNIANQTGVYGSNKFIYQVHSSADDTVHSFTVKDSNTYVATGCGVYLESTNTFKYYPTLGISYDECQIDKSGRWLMIKEQTDGLNGEDNRIIDLQTNTEATFLDENGAMGHSDMGFGYVIGADNFYAYPVLRLWQFGTSPLSPGTVVYRDLSWTTSSMAHISWGNATNGSLTYQYFCGSTASATNGPRANEVVCSRTNGTQEALVVAPVMTDLNASGGQDNYSRLPKGNLDPTGQYFVWTTNLGGSRMDAFVVKVPYQKLAVADVVAPTVSVTAPTNGATVSGDSVAITATASDDVSVAGVQFKLDSTTNLGTEDTVAPYSITWDSGTVPDGNHTITAVARDSSSNTTTSSAITVVVGNARQTPAPSNTGGAALPIGGGSFGNSSAKAKEPETNNTKLPQLEENKTQLIVDKGVYYLKKNGKLQGITSPGILLSNGFEFKDAVQASKEDLSLPKEGLLLPRDGSIVRSEKSRTIYLISNRKKHAFVSAKIFTSLSYKFSNLLTVTSPELDALPDGENIDQLASHLDGVDIAHKGTIYWIKDRRLHPYTSVKEYNQWNPDYDFSRVVSANTRDLELPISEPVSEKIR